MTKYLRILNYFIYTVDNGIHIYHTNIMGYVCHLPYGGNEIEQKKKNGLLIEN